MYTARGVLQQEPRVLGELVICRLLSALQIRQATPRALYTRRTSHLLLVGVTPIARRAPNVPPGDAELIEVSLKQYVPFQILG
jgi:hypothetical protein